MEEVSGMKSSKGRMKRGATLKYSEALAQNDDDPSIVWRPAEEILGNENMVEFGGSDSSLDDGDLSIPDIAFDREDGFDPVSPSKFPVPRSGSLLFPIAPMQPQHRNSSAELVLKKASRGGSNPQSAEESSSILTDFSNQVHQEVARLDQSGIVTTSKYQYELPKARKLVHLSKTYDYGSSWTLTQTSTSTIFEVRTLRKVFKTPTKNGSIGSTPTSFDSPDVVSPEKASSNRTIYDPPALPTVEEISEPSQDLSQDGEKDTSGRERPFPNNNSVQVDSLDEESQAMEVEEMEIQSDVRLRRKSSFNFCDACSKLFKTKDAFKGHMASEHGGKPFVCNVCDQVFYWKRSLEIHTNSHKPGEEGKKHACEVCHLRFQTKQHLDRHMTTHRKKKDYKCVICKKEFSRQDNLYSHFNKHVAEDECCSNCNVSFDHPKYFYQHLREERCSEY